MDNFNMMEDVALMETDVKFLLVGGKKKGKKKSKKHGFSVNASWY